MYSDNSNFGQFFFYPNDFEISGLDCTFEILLASIQDASSASTTNKFTTDTLDFLIMKILKVLH